MRPFRIAVVEDSQDCAELLTIYLQSYDVTTFGDPREALQRIPHGGFDLLLLDYVLPWMSGIDLLKSLRSEGLFIPTILLTGWPLRSPEPLQLVRMGVEDLIRKPFEEAQIVKAVEDVRQRIFRPSILDDEVRAAV